jgi:hypothetical protein
VRDIAQLACLALCDALLAAVKERADGCACSTLNIALQEELLLQL